MVSLFCSYNNRLILKIHESTTINRIQLHLRVSWYQEIYSKQPLVSTQITQSSIRRAQSYFTDCTRWSRSSRVISRWIGKPNFIESSADKALEEDLDSSSDESDSGDPEDFQDEKTHSNSRSFCIYGVGSQSTTCIEDCNTENAELKLIRSLKVEVLVLKQRWRLEKNLATLVYHMKCQHLCTLYRQFKRFAYQTTSEETDQLAGPWPGAWIGK